MKNRGHIRNAKGKARAIEALNDNPRIVERSVRPGFVVGRLVNDLRDLIGEAQHGFDLGAALNRLCEKPGYENLASDLRAELGQGEEVRYEPLQHRARRRWWKPWARAA